MYGEQILTCSAIFPQSRVEPALGVLFLPYAVRDPHMQLVIPICIQRSPYAYRDCHIQDPCMHTGIKINPRMHTGIPVCIRGSRRSPYAYGDNSDTDRMHMGSISIWDITNWIPICTIFHMGIAVHIWGSPYAYRQGSLKKLHSGIPFCIQKLHA